MSRNDRPALTTTLIRSRACRGVVTMATVGAIVLSGCSSEDDAYVQFCETSRDIAGMTTQIDTLVPDTEALNSARDGDFAALNTWGEATQKTVADVGAKFQSALDQAPDDDVSGAIETYLAMLDIFQQMAVASAEADNVDELATTLEDLNSQSVELADSMTEAGSVLATTEQVHCQ